MNDKDELQKPVVDLVTLLQSQQATMKFIAKPVPTKAAPDQLETAKASVDSISDTSKGLDRFANALFDVLNSEKNIPSITKASEGIQYAHLSLLAFDFIRVPFLLLLAKRLHKPVNFNLNAKIRWLYGGAAVALVALSIAFPPAALVIGFVLTGVGLFESIRVMWKMISKAIHLNKQIKEKEAEIAKLMEPLRDFHQQTIELVKQINISNENEKIALRHELISVSNKYNDYYKHNKNAIQSLVDERAVLQHRRNKINITKTLDRTIGLTFACAGLCGAILSLFFPPAGFIVLAATAGAGCVYGLVRLGMFIHSVIKLHKKAGTPSPAVKAVEEEQPSDDSYKQVKHQLSQTSTPTITKDHAVTPQITPVAQVQKDEPESVENDGEDKRPNMVHH